VGAAPEQPLTGLLVGSAALTPLMENTHQADMIVAAASGIAATDLFVTIRMRISSVDAQLAATALRRVDLEWRRT
jgi:hypothetical protein